MEEFVWEPEEVRVNVLTAATEAACTILSVDETIRNPKSEQDQADGRVRRALEGKQQPSFGRSFGQR
jgi:T-complex protein 1 subunit eta